MRIDGWKLDLSLWSGGMPPEVEAIQSELVASLNDEVRLTLLRLKAAWCGLPAYPETVSAWQIYDAVLHRGVQTLADLDGYLAAHDLPTLGEARRE